MAASRLRRAASRAAAAAGRPAASGDNVGPARRRRLRACCRRRSGSKPYGPVASDSARSRSGHLRFERSQARPARRAAGRRGPEVTLRRDRSARRPTPVCSAFDGRHGRSTAPDGFVGELRGLPAGGPWAGSSSCASSASAAAWPTTWVSARPCRCWRCCWTRRREPRTDARRRRWWWCPRSLVFNWKQEAARSRPTCACSITPVDRDARTAPLQSSTTCVLTTYGTLRRDIAAPGRESQFDYVILDEAQSDQERRHRARPRPSRLLRGRSSRWR